ncbi:RNase E specificity factor CsrD [Siccibacter turicensis]|uniref:RNase E specificity factor CsrD n=1 Tax=Siccibacter turicensis TaxID=357233 RepID=UPI003F54C7EB
MRLTTKLSALVTLLTGLVILITLIGCTVGFYQTVQTRAEQRVKTVAILLDNHLVTHSPERLADRLDELMIPADINSITFQQGDSPLFYYHRSPGLDMDEREDNAHTLSVPLLKVPGMTLKIDWQDPMASYFRSLQTAAPLTFSLLIVFAILFFALRWQQRQFVGQELLDRRAMRIIRGERGVRAQRSAEETPSQAGYAIDLLLAELENAGEQRSRIDTLIRAHAAQDTRTGLNNRLFFDNQLATLLEDHEKVGTHGVVMMIRLPDFDTLTDNWGRSTVEEYLFTLINMLSTFIMRYPGALLARYFRSDFAVLLPHRTLKEADSIASQLLNAVDSLPPTRMLDRSDMIHIGICAWRSGQSVDQVMEHAGMATRNAVLQGGNSWAVYDNLLPEKGRGHVRWRTLIEQALQRGGPRFYQKPAVTRDGRVHHREIMCRIFDGKEEVLSAEYKPLVQQFGLAEQYDTQQVSRVLPLLALWPEETLAMPVSVDSLISPTFQRWLRDALLECEKSQRQRIIFELAEAAVCQHISRLQPVVRLLNALGARVGVVQAGLTVVSTHWIKALNVELIKLDPGLVRNIEKRTENQLFVQSLVESCSGTQSRVFATGIRTRSEWQTLMDKGVAGGQGEFIAASQPVDTSVKKYLQRYSV